MSREVKLSEAILQGDKLLIISLHEKLENKSIHEILKTYIRR